MPLPAWFADAFGEDGGFAELTRIRLWRQFKHFVYLNCPAGPPHQGKGPAFRRGFPYANSLLLTALAALLLAGTIALAHRVVLLLLAGFLAASLLLSGVLILLTRILVLLLRHSGNSLVGRQERSNAQHAPWLPGNPVPSTTGNPVVK